MSKRRREDKPIKGCSHNHTRTEDFEVKGVTKPIKIHKVTCRDCGELLEWTATD